MRAPVSFAKLMSPGLSRSAPTLTGMNIRPAWTAGWAASANIPAGTHPTTTSASPASSPQETTGTVWRNAAMLEGLVHVAGGDGREPEPENALIQAGGNRAPDDAQAADSDPKILLRLWCHGLIPYH